MLDAILSPEWEYRYYSFNVKWAPEEQMGSMRNGSGDDLFALFNAHGCFIKGFDHEALMSPYGRQPKAVWPGVLDAVPKAFERGLSEPAFAMEDTTFCIWRQYGDEQWHRGVIEFPPPKLRFDGAPLDPDGSGDLLSPYDGNPVTYLAWAIYRFGGLTGENLTLEHVQHVYDHKPLTAELVREINPELPLGDLDGDIEEIGYPRRGAKKD
ncbi:hypothetical protein C1280_23465 [Gemmata obscuriglobus]|uniref:Uncharacterized protein n=2 Tax=Gemmata obscuriglobus TaxID=114 RepID=A0A2Z3H685_9BACT|nr:hypothetical protein C1280_23465 [Gemmata obscuriglobus]